ncbi:MAG TPA: S41 family peptidase [Candidatus Polarisedimenticolaceae bacterium]|nr:S41 family peptidase [Candidatus Polarisedimenticolaceae bacterium]
MRTFALRSIILLTLVAVLGVTVAHAEAAYIRFPDLNGNRVVFCAEGDLWSVSDSGGVARRLTNHVGNEFYPHWSPDGKWIAFTGEYDGNSDVYLIPAEGGEPRRLTWHPGAEIVLGWTPDGSKILYRSTGETPYRSSAIYAISRDGGDPTMLPLGYAERIAIDPATGKYAFSRKSWENATWKRYRGGTAPDIWVGDPAKADFKKVTSFDGVNAYPMWHGGRIYFLSDPGGTMNLWSIKADGSDRKRETDFKDWDARQPAIAPDGRIVFTLQADLHIFDPKSGTVKKVDVDVPSDRVLTRQRYPDAGQYVTSFDLSPDGSRLAITARGEIFSVPAKPGVTIPITRGSGARESYGRFSGDGKKIIYVTDATGEEEIRSIDAWDREPAKTVEPARATGWHFGPKASPDGKWLAYGDQTQSLYVMPAEGGERKVVDKSPLAEINDYTWSADGRWLAYTKVMDNGYTAINVYDTVSGVATTLGNGTTNDNSPAWDPKGRWLYFVSERTTNPLLGQRDFDVIEAKNSKLYLAILKKDGNDPMANLEGMPPDEAKKDDKKDEAKADEKKGGDKKDADKKDEKKAEPVDIDVAGVFSRVVELKVPVGNYSNLAATDKTLFYVSHPVQGMVEDGGDDSPDGTLMAFDLDKKDSKTFVEGIGGYVLAKDGKLAIQKKRGEIFVVDAGSPPGGELGKGKVDLSDCVINLDPREEWKQIYQEAYRFERDFYWDNGMGGLDWKAMRDKYQTLLPRVATRSDLRDLIGELIGELGTSHTYVSGGDPGSQAKQVGTGLLGGDFTREGDVYKINRIYRADPADNVRSSLEEPGVGVKEGDYILAIDHRPFEKGKSFYAALEGRAGKEVVLTVGSSASKEGSRDVVVKAMDSDKRLRYCDWVRMNREYVAKKTDGKIGYIHLPDMGRDGLVAFETWFYPQLKKEGMVVDVRWNGGGFVSQLVVERMRRDLISFDRSRGGGVETYPQRVLNGPFVVLTNEHAGSDGDIFPAAVQLEHLAPVIGMRSWGGVVGIRGDKPTVDGGMLTQPEFAWWDPKQGWGLENRGVIPDIEVQNLPQDLAKGIDTQLDRAIAEVMKLRDAHPPVKPKFDPIRDRSRKAFERENPNIKTDVPEMKGTGTQ